MRGWKHGEVMLRYINEGDKIVQVSSTKMEDAYKLLEHELASLEAEEHPILLDADIFRGMITLLIDLLVNSHTQQTIHCYLLTIFFISPLFSRLTTVNSSSVAGYGRTL